ncbi:MAG: LicD family protein [Clostridia bacterium]|nr:LicD family protein [Clostridia bacterium]
MVKMLELEQEGTVATLEEHQKAMYRLLVAFDEVCRKLNIQYFLFAGTLLGAVRHKGFIPWDDDLDVLMLRQDYEQLLREAPAIFEKENLFLQQEHSEHFPMFFSKLRINGTTCLEPYYPKDNMMHQGVYMDIFPCDNAYNSKIGRWLQFAASKVVIAKALDAEGYVTNSKLKKIVMRVSRCLPRVPFQRIVRGPKKQNEFVHSFLGGSSRIKRSVYPSEIFSESIELPFEGGSFRCPQRYDLLLETLYGDYMKIPAPEERKCKKHAVLVDLKNSYDKYAEYRENMRIEHSTRSIR